jgi:hypothetical protein
MGVIGDLYFALRADGKTLQADVKKEGAKAGTTFGATMVANFKKSWSGAEIGKGFVQGLGLAGGLGAAHLFSQAISTITNVIGDMTAAAIADEESVHRLGASLKANVPNFDGNTDAIEANIKAHQRLGFEDETLRDSLTVLVGATHDVSKAESIMGTAMDLARFKGIDLRTASEALIKVQAGQYRSLKQLGIQLPKNATATEALAAVQAVAQGQAEAYAETNAGKLAASQIKVDEAMENLGKKTMPLVVGSTLLAADAATTLVTALDLLTGKTPQTTDEFHENTDALRGLSDALGTVFPSLKLLGAAADEADKDFERSMRGSTTSVEKLKGAAAEDLNATALVLDDTGEAAEDMADDIKMSARISTDSFETMRDKIIGAAEDIVGDAYDVLDDAAALSAANAKIAEAERTLASSKSSDAQKADAKDVLREVGRDQAQLVLDLTKAGEGGSAKVAAAIADMKKRLETATGNERKAILATLAALEAVEAQAKVTFRSLVKTNRVIPAGQRTDASRERLAEGGPAKAGIAYTVGERGRELFIPDVDGQVVPHAPTMALLQGGAGGGDTVNLTLYGRPLDAESPADVVRELRRAQRLGLPPRRSQPRFKAS